MPIKTTIKVVSPSEQNKSTRHLLRRGIDSGYIQLVDRTHSSPPIDEADNTGVTRTEKIRQLWQTNQPIHLPDILANSLSKYTSEINQTRLFYEAVLNEEEVEDILDAEPYLSSLGERFQLLSSRFDEADQQEIISVDFDVMDGDKLLMEDIWMRISWLSYHEEDESFRFRFSFGMENFDDVSSDPERQLAAAELSQRVFPESAIITENTSLIELLCKTLDISSFNFVERIIYFNAENGGAQFHHDAEKGHLGVVYAQLTGETFWLALSRAELIDEITKFALNEKNTAELKDSLEASMTDERVIRDFIAALSNKEKLSEMLNDPGNEEISALLNESKPFFNQLVSAGYGYHLIAGDIMLLPQESMQDCAWHSVFCLGDEAGEALSFAIKSA